MVEQNPDAWKAGFIAFVTTGVAAILKWWPRKRKSDEDNRASLAEIYTDRLQDIMNRNKQEIESLRSEVRDLRQKQLESAVRHRAEMDAAERRYRGEVESAERRHMQLMDKYEDAMEEISRLRSQLPEAS